jgi:fructose-specific phosphotransferase system IIA component
LKLTDYINKDLICIDLSVRDKNDALHKMTHLLKHHHLISDADEFLQEVLQRENLGSTCVGQGIAIPHARTKTVKQIILALARLKEPIDFGADDKQPVHLIFMLGTPVDAVGEYLKVLASISRLLCKPALREQILQAPSPAAIISLLKDAEKEMTVTYPSR